jgi:hypothetical protein
MALPVTFATLAAGNEPLSLFDTQFAAVAALGIIPCTATGVNTIALAPNAGTPNISSYTSLAPSFAFIAAATSTGAVTINVNGIGPINAFKWNGQQALAAGDIVSGSTYKATYNATLNGFIVDSVGVNNSTADIEFIIDGGGVAITTGVKGFIRIPWPATVVNWEMAADQTGSIAVDILRANAAIPVTSIVGGGNKPTLTAAQFANATAPSGWTSTSLVSNDWIGFSVTSAATMTRVTVDLILAKL